MPYGRIALLLSLFLACNNSPPADNSSDTNHMVRLGTFSEPRTSGVTDLFVYSPWEPVSYARVGFPEHCWGKNLPNTSHDSDTLVSTPWRISPDSGKAVFERQPRPGVTFIARAETDSMAVRLSIRIENESSEPVNDIRALVCFKPDATRNNPSRDNGLLAFRDTSYRSIYFPSSGKRIKLNDQTTYHGDYPPGTDESNRRYRINWGVNIEGRPDVRTMDAGAWFLGNNPGRMVEEKADPALIAVHADGDTTRWIGLIWEPARVLFCNPLNPCLHSDPAFEDCPPGSFSSASGMIFFHEGNFDGLLERVLDWKSSLTKQGR